MKKESFLKLSLTRGEMKSVLGGYMPLPNTFLCDCGSGTMMDVYGQSIGDVISNYRMAVGGACSSHATVTCVPEVED